MSQISLMFRMNPAPNPRPPNLQTSAPINKEAKKELQKQQKIFQQLEEQIAKLTEQKSATGSIISRSFCVFR